jgi:hypothetical protein
MTLISLPGLGIFGNPQMFMRLRINLEVADVILNWIVEHVENRYGKGH